VAVELLAELQVLVAVLLVETALQAEALRRLLPQIVEAAEAGVQ
jgi:hypothetical protein